MERDSRRSVTERYGICLNDECEKCQNKELQKIPLRKDFVCSKCGKELRECPPPKKTDMKRVLTIISLLVIAAIVACLLLFSNSSSDQEENTLAADTTQVATTVDTVAVETAAKDTIQPVEEPAQQEEVAEEAKENVQPTTQELDHTDLGYAKYYGKVNAKGLPHDKGARMVYSQVRRISQYDSQNRKSAVGDYIIGEWLNGELVQGRWYDKNNNLKGSIIIGVR